MNLRLIALMLFCAGPALAQVTFYTGASALTTWQAAAGGTPVTLNFESVGAGTQANDPTFVTQAALAGVVFQPFANSTYPQVINGDGGHGADGAQWLGNVLAQGYALGNAITWTFSQPIRAFGFFDVGSDDGFTVTVYSAGLVSLGTFDTAEQNNNPLFWGFLADQDIGKVAVQPRIGNGYIGIDGLKTVAVPEPAASAAAMGLAALLAQYSRRRRAQFVH